MHPQVASWQLPHGPIPKDSALFAPSHKDQYSGGCRRDTHIQVSLLAGPSCQRVFWHLTCPACLATHCCTFLQSFTAICAASVIIDRHGSCVLHRIRLKVEDGTYYTNAEELMHSLRAVCTRVDVPNSQPHTMVTRPDGEDASVIVCQAPQGEVCTAAGAYKVTRSSVNHVINQPVMLLVNWQVMTTPPTDPAVFQATVSPWQGWYSKELYAVIMCLVIFPAWWKTKRWILLRFALVLRAAIDCAVLVQASGSQEHRVLQVTITYSEAEGDALHLGPDELSPPPLTCKFTASAGDITGLHLPPAAKSRRTVLNAGTPARRTIVPATSLSIVDR